MAKKQETPKPKKRTGGRSLLSTFQSPRTTLIAGLSLILLSVLMLIAFCSFMSTGEADQSLVERILRGESLPPHEKNAKNVIGMFGAVLSYFFMFRWFGIGSFLLIPVLFVSGVKWALSRELYPLKSLTLQALFYMVWISATLGWLVQSYEIGAGFWSGQLGSSINEIIMGVFRMATIAVLLMILVIFVIYFYQINNLEPITQRIENLQVPKLGFWGKAKAYWADLWVSEEDEEFEDVPTVRTPRAERPAEPATAEQYPTEEFVPEAHPKRTTRQPDEEPEFIIETNPQPIVDENVTTDPQTISDEDLIKKLGLYDPTLDLPRYQYPPIELLQEHQSDKGRVTEDELKAKKDTIIQTLKDYGITISSITATPGPTVTLYEIVPSAGVKISRIKSLEDDIALSLAALGIRIIAPMPGKGTVGIEVPNKNREIVSIRQVLASEKFQKAQMDLPVVLGKTISNDIFVTDLAKMPHLLIAGATGQGKSVGMNVVLASLLYRKHPAQLKLVLVDPKKVELSIFSKIERHFLAKLPNQDEAIITDTKKVIHTLNSLCIEMDSRYELLKNAGCRNLKEYNQKFIERRLNPEKGHKFLPYIVLVIDELADLMMTAGKEVETPIARLAQLARAIGIHLIVATQRPSVDIITGKIKANFPARLSFKVTQKVDSRTILDTSGAEQLVGQGDMLFLQGSDLIRLQCPFVDTPEVDAFCDFIGEQQGYGDAYFLPEFEGDDSGNDDRDVDLGQLDGMFKDAARLVVIHQQGSTSLIQRKMKLGYNRAGRIMDQLEAAGIVGSFEGSKAREVLIQSEERLDEVFKELKV